MKVLICEEDASRAKLMKDILAGYSLKFITVTKGGDLFKTISAQKPAVLIINEDFTNKSSKDILTKLRSDPLTKNIPVILISKEHDIRKKLNEFVSDAYLEMFTEPFKIKNLRHAVDRWTTFRSLYVKQ